MQTSIKSSSEKMIFWLPLILIGAISVPATAIAEEDPNSLPLKIVRIEKNSAQEVTRVIVDKEAIVPKELLDLLPKKDTSKLTKMQIRDIAKKHRLFTEWKVNPVLQFQDGDISYFYEQGLPAWNLELQFLARRIVIERAEEAKGKIQSKGDLAAFSEPVFSWLHELASKKWEQDK